MKKKSFLITNHNNHRCNNVVIDVINVNDKLNATVHSIILSYISED